MIFDRKFEDTKEIIKNDSIKIVENILTSDISAIIVATPGNGKTTITKYFSEYPSLQDPQGVSDAAPHIIFHTILKTHDYDTLINGIHNPQKELDSAPFYLSNKFLQNGEYLSNPEFTIDSQKFTIPNYCLRYQGLNILAEESITATLYDMLIRKIPCPIFDDIYLKMDYTKIFIDISSLPKTKDIPNIIHLITELLTTKQVIILCTPEVLSLISKKHYLENLLKIELPPIKDPDFYNSLFSLYFDSTLPPNIVTKFIEKSTSISNFLTISSFYNIFTDENSEEKAAELALEMVHTTEHKSKSTNPILHYIFENGPISIKTLRKQFPEVSDSTIRRIVNSAIKRETLTTIKNEKNKKEILYKKK